MILARYLTKEVLNTLLAVTFVLLLIFMSQQIVRYLGYAAVGKLAPNMLLQLLGFEIPFLLALLLPLGIYLGIIITYGRLYADNEMIVMQSCGLSSKDLFKITSVFTIFITALVLGLMVWINPIIAVKRDQLLAQVFSVESILNSLMPGRFQVSPDGKRVVYVESVSHDHKQANNIFIANQAHQPISENAPSEWTVVSASQGAEWKDPATHQSFLVASHGSRYEGIPGQNDYKIFQFKTYAVELPTSATDAENKDVETMPTFALLKQYHDPDAAAEFQWRFSIPISALLLALLALPLSHVAPRQGRYSQIFPAILIYVIYVNLLFVARNWLEQKTVPISLGIWWVHGVFLLLVGLFIFFRSKTFKQWIKRA